VKTAVLKGIRQIELVEKPVPEISPGQVLVKVEYCGICGSDVHAYQTGLFAPETVMGHEFSATIETVGDGVDGFNKGDRVVILPGSGEPCHECYYCKNGTPNLCQNTPGVAPGLTPALDGGFAEYAKIPYPKSQLVRLPSELSLKEAALCEPLAVAFHCVNLSKFKTGREILVIGAGPIGLSIIDILRLKGAGKITVIEKSKQRGELAREFGAGEVLNPDDFENPFELRSKVFDLNSQMGPEIIYECAGMPETFVLSTTLLRNSGQIMVASIIEKEATFLPLGITLGELEIKGSYGFLESDFEEACTNLAKGKLRAPKMISDVISLDEIVEKGFNELTVSQGKIKIMVKPKK